MQVSSETWQEVLCNTVKMITLLAAAATSYESSSADIARSGADDASAAAVPRASFRGTAAERTWALGTTSPRI